MTASADTLRAFELLHRQQHRDVTAIMADPDDEQARQHWRDTHARICALRISIAKEKRAAESTAR